NNVNVIADNTTEILALSVAGAAATGQFAGAGSVTVNNISDDTLAQIGDASTSVESPTSVSALSVKTAAKGSGDIGALAGGFAFSSGGSAIGAAAAVNEISGSVKAKMVDTKIRGANTLKVKPSPSDLTNPAADGAITRSLAVAGAASGGSAALSGSATANTIS